MQHLTLFYEQMLVLFYDILSLVVLDFHFVISFFHDCRDEIVSLL